MNFPKNNTIICGIENENFAMRYQNSRELSPGFLQCGYNDFEYCLLEFKNNSFIKRSYRWDYDKNHYNFWKKELQRAMGEYSERVP